MALPGMAIPGLAGIPIAGSIEAFIAKNNIDASAGAKLRALSPQAQQLVLERGDLQDARNPNAVLMGRIRDAEQNARGPLPPISTAPASSDVEQFIADNRIDPSAGNKLRALPEDIQKTVMSRGNLTDARNPNAMLMGRIRDAERGNP